MKITFPVCAILLLSAGAAHDSDPPAIDGALQMLPAAPATVLVSRFGAYEIDLPPTVAPANDEPDTLALKVAYVAPAPPNLLPEAFWQELDAGGHVLRVDFRSEGALALRLQFRGDFGADGLELRVYDPAGDAVFGPYSHPPLSADGTWWAPTIYGTALGLEFYLPAGATFPPALPEIVAVAYSYTLGLAPDADCLFDVMCVPAWVTSARAVGRMYFVSGGNGFNCTGAMLNRDNSDFTPMFMTARHCISTEMEANTLEVIWFYQTDKCDGTVPDLNTLPRNNGSLLLKTHATSEWTLLGLWEPSKTDTFPGWDANYWANDNVGVGIHHPGGSHKRFTSFKKTGDSDCLGATSEWYCQTMLGAARPGSSGSPAFDLDQRVRGTLSCAGPDKYTSCPPDEWLKYGQFSAAFPVVRWYLYQMAAPTYVNRAFGGDPGNGGDQERGTVGNPFNTVHEGTYCVPAGGQVLIQAGVYDESTMRNRKVWRPMTLRAVGGVVTIR